LMRALTSTLALAALACCLTSRPGRAEAGVFIAVAPPVPLVEVVPGPPAVGYVWRPGYWRWRRYHYVWRPGVYVVAPRPRAIWVPGYYLARPRGWVYVPGRWR
jgi:hypothetical protein